MIQSAAPRDAVHVHLGMTDQRSSLLYRLGSHESVAHRRAVLIGDDGVGEHGHGAWMLACLRRLGECQNDLPPKNRSI